MKQNRVDAVLQNLEQLGLSQMLITDPLAIFYLTGRMIQPLERFYGLYVNRRGGHKIFINLLETVPEDLGVEKVRFSDADPVLDLVAAAVDSGEPLGVDKNLPARFLLPLIERGAAGGFVNASLAIDRARAVKDAQERALMRRASQLNDMALEQLRPWITAGVSERELAERLTKIYRELGADGTSFDPLVAFGANAASGHHWPDGTRLKTGDCVLVDAPCSGLGVLRRRAEARWRKTKKDLEVFPPLQKAILNAAARYVKPGGRLVYSTCTLEAAENHELTAAFLAAHPDFEPAVFKHPLTGEEVSELQLLPQRDNVDGFYICAMQRKENKA